jgi:hypothetical protein
MTISGPRTYVFVKVLADDGRYGIGEAYGTPGVGVKEQIEAIGPLLVGKDPLEIDVIYTYMGRGAGKTISTMGGPLSLHPRLNAELATALYLWVGQSLRHAIVDRFDVDVAALDASIAASMSDGKPRAKRSGPDSSQIKLVDKLAAAGQLKPGYLVRVLKEQQLGLFEAALAKLGGFRVEEVHRAVTSPDRPEMVALALAAVGVDRSVFPTILEMVRQCNDGLPGGGAEGARRASSAFGPFSAEIAASAFRQAVSAS